MSVVSLATDELESNSGDLDGIGRECGMRIGRNPYGWSHCCDKHLSLGLLDYAQAHGGKFPAGSATPEASLGLLYPEYRGANVLRGKTVPEEVVAQRLEAGQPLTRETCGWHYVDGLTLARGGSSFVAIFWDKAGLGHNGERLSSGRFVEFMDGHVGYIRAADWPEFMADQEKFWAAVRNGEQLEWDSPDWFRNMR